MTNAPKRRHPGRQIAIGAALVVLAIVIMILTAELTGGQATSGAAPGEHDVTGGSLDIGTLIGAVTSLVVALTGLVKAVKGLITVFRRSPNPPANPAG